MSRAQLSTRGVRAAAIDPAPAEGGRDARERVMGDNPLADTVIESFYRPRPQADVPAQAVNVNAVAAGKSKPTHYKIVCISLYTEDIERLEKLVAELKRRGHTKANKSQLIRAALDQVDLDRVPKGY